MVRSRPVAGLLEDAAAARTTSAPSGRTSLRVVLGECEHFTFEHAPTWFRHELALRAGHRGFREATASQSRAMRLRADRRGDIACRSRIDHVGARVAGRHGVGHPLAKVLLQRAVISSLAAVASESLRVTIASHDCIATFRQCASPLPPQFCCSSLPPLSRLPLPCPPKDTFVLRAAADPVADHGLQPSSVGWWIAPRMAGAHRKSLCSD